MSSIQRERLIYKEKNTKRTKNRENKQNINEMSSIYRERLINPQSLWQPWEGKIIGKKNQ